MDSELENNNNVIIYSALHVLTHLATTQRQALPSFKVYEDEGVSSQAQGTQLVEAEFKSRHSGSSGNILNHLFHKELG